MLVPIGNSSNSDYAHQSAASFSTVSQPCRLLRVTLTVAAHALSCGGAGCGRGRWVYRHFSSCSAEHARRCFSRAWLGVAARLRCVDSGNALFLIIAALACQIANCARVRDTRMRCVTQLVAAHQQFGFENCFQFVRRPVRTVNRLHRFCTDFSRTFPYRSAGNCRILPISA